VNIEELYLTDEELEELVTAVWKQNSGKVYIGLHVYDKAIAKFAVDNAVKKIVEDIKNPFVGYIDAFENIRMAKEQGFERFR